MYRHLPHIPRSCRVLTSTCFAPRAGWRPCEGYSWLACRRDRHSDARRSRLRALGCAAVPGLWLQGNQRVRERPAAVDGGVSRRAGVGWLRAVRPRANRRHQHRCRRVPGPRDVEGAHSERHRANGDARRAARQTQRAKVRSVAACVASCTALHAMLMFASLTVCARRAASERSHSTVTATLSRWARL